MCAILICVFTVLVSTPSPEPDPVTLRARAVLALVFSAPGAKTATYSQAYALAVKESRPLVVFVGQPVRDLSGCVCTGSETFPGLTAEAVVVGVPDGSGLRRVDLPGRPTDAAIRAVVGTAPGSNTAVLPAAR